MSLSSRLPASITPELALVDAELADAARRALPERPWERFAPPSEERAVVPIGSIVAPPRTEEEPAAAIVIAPLVPPSTDGRRVGSSRRRLAAEAVAAVAVLAAALTWASSQTPALGFGAGEPATESGDGAQAGAPEASPHRRFTFPSGLVDVSPDGRTGSVSLTSGCAAGGRTPVVSLGAGSLVYEGRLAGTPVDALFRVRFEGASRASVSMTLRGPGCPLGEFVLTAVAR